MSEKGRRFFYIDLENFNVALILRFVLIFTLRLFFPWILFLFEIEKSKMEKLEFEKSEENKSS